MKKKGYKAKGVEANEPYAAYSRSELEVDISVQPFSQYNSDEEFDLITMFHVLEHLEHPVRDLRKLAERLKPDGHFIIEVPNILFCNMSFSHKWHPGHLFSYTSGTLSEIARKAGMQEVQCSPVGDGGNLWGIFRKSHESPASEPSNRDILEGSKTLRKLRRAALAYFANPKNYSKFFPKLMSQLSEKRNSRDKAGREILDSLYH